MKNVAFRAYDTIFYTFDEWHDHHFADELVLLANSKGLGCANKENEFRNGSTDTDDWYQLPLRLIKMIEMVGMRNFPRAMQLSAPEFDIPECLSIVQ